jgi:hypothetical protein
MLSSGLECYRVLKEDGKLTVLSTLDKLEIGENKQLPGSFPTTDLEIYAEGIELAGPLRCRNAVLSVSSLRADAKKQTEIDVSGEQGTNAVGENMDPNKSPGDPGGNGLNGGNLFLYTEGGDAGTLIPKLLATGGKGGNGQGGTSQTAGGNGGCGGNGGVIQVAYIHPYTGLIKKLENIYQQPASESKQYQTDQLIAAIVTDPTLAGVLAQALKSYEKSRDCDAFILSAVRSLGLLILNTDSKMQLKTEGGAYGVHGVGNPSGKNGAAGLSGKTYKQSLENLSELTELKIPVKPVHGAQCRMLLEKLKIMYFAMTEKTLPDVASGFQRLVTRTAVFKDLTSGHPLFDIYNNGEKHPCRELTDLQGINAEASGLLNNLKNGLDIFGLRSDYAPTASFSFYRDIQEKLVANFGILEEKYNKYYADMLENKATMDAFKSMTAQLNQTINALDSDIEKEERELFIIAERINTYQLQLVPLHKALLEKIDEFQAIIKKHFQFSLKDFVSVVATVAKQPQNVLGWSKELAQIGMNHMTQLTDDTGKAVDKKLLIDKVRVVEGKVDSIIDTYHQENSGMITVDDMSACKLIAAEEELMGVFSKFYEDFPQELDELEKLFKEYIDAMIGRNTQILLYNTTVSQIILQSASLKNAKAQKEHIDSKKYEEFDPMAPEIAAFVSQMYYSARTDVMKNLSLTARAYQLWSLSEKNLMSAILSKQPKDLNHAFFVKCQSDILGAYQLAVENFGGGAGPFPNKKTQPGIQVSLSHQQIELLKKNHQVTINLQPAFSETSKLENPFCGYYNIRIQTVRAWVNNAQTTDRNLHVKITNLGNDGYVNMDNRLQSFQQAQITTSFEYNLDSKNDIVRDGDMGWKDDSTKGIYALLSPFASWRISIKDDYNPGLNLDAVDEVILEFRGTSYSFDVS